MDKTLNEMLVFKMDKQLFQGLYKMENDDTESIVGEEVNFSFNT